MKKAVVIFIIALVAVASAFAFEFKSVGIETGKDFISDYYGFYAVSADMEVADNLDVYGRLGALSGLFTLSAGAQYNVATVEIENSKLDVKPGAQMGFSFGDGFLWTILGACEFSFETGSLGAFVRPGLGFGIAFYRDYNDKLDTSASFIFEIETGVRYMF